MRTPVAAPSPRPRKFRKPSVLEYTEQILKLPLSAAQRTIVKAMAGQLLTGSELALFKLMTGREVYTPRYYRNVTVAAGARGGKTSMFASPRVEWEALYAGHERKLAVGERGLVALVAQDHEAAGIAFSYVAGHLRDNPLLNSQVATYLNRAIILKNGLEIRTFPSTAAALRGYTIVAAVLDEVAYFPTEGAANSDEDIETAVLRGMGTLQGPLIKISTPAGQRGILYRDIKRGWGHDDPDLLCFKAPTSLLNPAFPDLDHMAAIMAPARFAMEFLAEFASDLTAFLPPAIIERAVDYGVAERMPQLGKHRYFAFVDMASTGPDSHALSIGHDEATPDLLGTGGQDRLYIQDLLWGANRATSELTSIIPQMAEHLARFNLSKVYGDRYTGTDGWIAAEFRRHGIEYETPTWIPANATEPTYADKSTIYMAVAPLFLANKVKLLDSPFPLVKELTLLQQSPGSGGKPRVDHPRGSSDDFANATCGMLHVLSGKGRSGPPIGHSLGVPRGGGPTAVGGVGRSRGLGAVGGQAAHLGGFYSPPGTRWQ